MAEFILNVIVFIVIIVLLAAAGYVVVLLGTTPGKIARRRGHPQADAINVCSWLGIVFLFSFFLFWPVALIWAYTRPSPKGTSGEPLAGELGETKSLEQLTARLEALEERVGRLPSAQGAES